MVSQRRRLLDHLKTSDEGRYTRPDRDPGPAPLGPYPHVPASAGGARDPLELVRRAPRQAQSGADASGPLEGLVPITPRVQTILIRACRLERIPEPPQRPPPLSAPARNAAAGLRKKTKMFDIKRKTIEWGGRTLTLETGRIARQADGAVLATYGETTVLATVVVRQAAQARASTSSR